MRHYLKILRFKYSIKVDCSILEKWKIKFLLTLSFQSFKINKKSSHSRFSNIYNKKSVNLLKKLRMNLCRSKIKWSKWVSIKCTEEECFWMLKLVNYMRDGFRKMSLCLAESLKTLITMSVLLYKKKEGFAT